MRLFSLSLSFSLVLGYLDIFSDIIYKVSIWVLCVCVFGCVMCTFQYIFTNVNIHCSYRFIQVKQLDDCRRNCEKPDGWDLIKKGAHTTPRKKEEEEERERRKRTKVSEKKREKMQRKRKMWDFYQSILVLRLWILCWAKRVLLQAIACYPSKQSHIIFIFFVSLALFQSIFEIVLPAVDFCVRLTFHI